MAKKPTVPIKVTAHLKDGRFDSVDGIMMLDSILYHAWFAKYAPEVLEGKAESKYNGYIGLPLRREENNRWAASRGVYQQIGQGVDYINKRQDFFNPDKIDYLDTDKGIISSTIGMYRLFRIPHIIRTCTGDVTWWAMGHQEDVKELLGYISAIGKKNSAGYGAVISWDVEECEEDYSLWHPEYGLMRPVEIGSADEQKLGGRLKDYMIAEYCVRPPYWKHSANSRRCYIPIKIGANNEHR